MTSMPATRRGQPVDGCSSRCRRPSSTCISMARCGSPRRSSSRARAGSRRQTAGSGCPRRSSGRCQACRRPSCCERFDLPIALMQDAEALERIAAELVETRLPTTCATSRSAGDRCSTSWAGCRSRMGSPRSSAARVLPRRVRASRSASSRRRCGRTIRSGTSNWQRRQPGSSTTGSPVGTLPARRRRTRTRWCTDARSTWRARTGSASRSTPVNGAAAAQVRRALVVDPERIAHGPGAIDDPALCAELIARGITLDLAPPRTGRAAIVPSVAEHPIGPLYRMGVPVTLNTDDLTVSDLKLSEEYINAARTDRSRAPRPLGDRPPCARCRLRRRDDARPSARGLRPVGRECPGAGRPGRLSLEGLERSSELLGVGGDGIGSLLRRQGIDVRLVAMPVSISTLRAPMAFAPARSVMMPSPTTMASAGERPTASAANSNRCGSGLPIVSGVTDVVASSAAAIEPAPGRSPRSVG